ncbi:MAG: hypothetical protein ACYS8W_00050 [Planctomycetota bacterium]
MTSKMKLMSIALTLIALCCLASCQLFSKATGDSGLGSKVDAAEKSIEEFGKALDNFAKLVEDAKAADDPKPLLDGVDKANANALARGKAAEDKVKSVKSSVESASDSPAKTMNQGRITKVEADLRAKQAKYVEVQGEAVKLRSAE